VGVLRHTEGGVIPTLKGNRKKNLHTGGGVGLTTSTYERRQQKVETLLLEKVTRDAESAALYHPSGA